MTWIDKHIISIIMWCATAGLLFGIIASATYSTHKARPVVTESKSAEFQLQLLVDVLNMTQTNWDIRVTRRTNTYLLPPPSSKHE